MARPLEVAEAMRPPDMPPLVLVVEDEPVLRLNAAQALQSSGFRVVDATDAGEALQRLRHQPDEVAVAVIDLGLPDLPGEELVRRLREIRRVLPIVIASGYSRRRVRTLFAGMEGVAFLEKPYGTDDLVAAVKALIDVSPREMAATSDHLPCT